MSTTEHAESRDPGGDPRGGRKPSRRRPAGRLVPAGADDPTALAGLGRRLGAADPARRRALAAEMRGRMTGYEQVALADATLAALLRTRPGSSRAGLAAALVALGAVAGPSVGSALLRVKVDWQRAELAGVLELLAPDLPRDDQVALIQVLRVLLGRVGDEPVVRAFVAVAVALGVDPTH